jgi:hypothetical protein
MLTFGMQMEKYSDKLPGIISQERKAVTPFETGNCPITDGILGNIVRHTNNYILIRPNFSRSSDAKLTDKIELKALIGTCG